MGHARKEQITIMTTNECTLRCQYCAAHSSEHQDNIQKIDLGFAKRGISDFFENGGHQIRYYSGGEPTKAMDILKETWKYAKSLLVDKDKELISEIQTNCYFDSDTADWIRNNINLVWVSIDGWKDINDKYRPAADGKGSYDVAINNALYIKEKTFVGIRFTVVPETVDKQIDILKHFINLGFNYFCSEPVFTPVKKDSGAGKITGVDIKMYTEEFVKAWHFANENGVTYVNYFISNFDEKVDIACRTCLPAPHLTTDGYVSSCDIGYYGDTPLKDLIYGKYNREKDIIEYNEEAINKLRSRKCTNIPGCTECEVKDYCGGGCLGRAYHETRDFYGKIPEYCWAVKYLAQELPIGEISIPYLHP